MLPGITSIAFRNTQLYIEEMLPKVSAAGFRALEVWGGHVENRDELEMPVVAELAERHGLKLPMLSCYLGTFDLDMTNLDAELEKARFAARTGAALGVPWLRSFAGWVMECSSRDASAEYWDYCIRGIREIAAVAAADRLGLALETHKLTLADTVRGCRRLIDEIASPSVKLILQLDGPAETEKTSPVDVWNELKGLVVHFHQKPESAPWGVEEMRRLFAKMREDGYSGAVSIEGVHPNVKAEAVMKQGMKLLQAAGVA
ncbi:MAG TPA: sugar phosphate isomerase/epimerase [Planctomycetes bacterium]|nr:sugar phosphate isomerase/epimerase [Planctomycetota bacterium]